VIGLALGFVLFGILRKKPLSALAVFVSIKYGQFSSAFTRSRRAPTGDAGNVPAWSTRKHEVAEENRKWLGPCLLCLVLFAPLALLRATSTYWRAGSRAFGVDDVQKCRSCRSSNSWAGSRGEKVAGRCRSDGVFSGYFEVWHNRARGAEVQKFDWFDRQSRCAGAHPPCDFDLSFLGFLNSPISRRKNAGVC
jgi:hypothetical protein